MAKYLQTLFDKEAENGKNVLVADKLLAGKTRKEASRMFFETLVCPKHNPKQKSSELKSSYCFTNFAGS